MAAPEECTYPDAAEAPKPLFTHETQNGDGITVVRDANDYGLYSVKLNERIILQIDSSPNPVDVVDSGRLKHEDYILFSSSNSDGCPDVNHLLVVGHNGFQVYLIGNCNPPEIAVKANSLEIEYPGWKEAGRSWEGWRYQNGRLTPVKRKGPR